MFAKAPYKNQIELRQSIQAARGEIEVDLLIDNVHYLDVFTGQFVKGSVAIYAGKIVGLDQSYQAKVKKDAQGAYLVPGFIDAHLHIESSMMIPASFERAVLPHGTTTVIWDPHEIANVWGQDGIRWALASSEGLALDFLVMAPSCVPSTNPAAGLEQSGAVLNAKDLSAFKDHPRVLGLAEMMNFPGLLSGDADVMDKLELFSDRPRDGHCPGLSGMDLNAYGTAGICSCHESTTLEEAQEKLRKGIHVWIREGSCAKDASTLLPLLDQRSAAALGFCSDDRNPLDIAHEGHISRIIQMALERGHDPIDVFRTASWSVARSYQLMDRGAIAPGYAADMVLLRPQGGSWNKGIHIDAVYKSGNEVAGYLKSLGPCLDPAASIYKGRKNLNLDQVCNNAFAIKVNSDQPTVRVIGVRPGQIVTDHLQRKVQAQQLQVKSDFVQDILKIAVFERHHSTKKHSVALVHGFGIQRGAIATSINHDCHNVIVVGSSDALMADAVNRLIDMDGGIVVVDDQGGSASLELLIGGLMSDREASYIADRLLVLKAKAREIGCALEEPFLSLSFLALPVIPHLKITDQGLVDVDQFKLVSLA